MLLSSSLTYPVVNEVDLPSIPVAELVNLMSTIEHEELQEQIERLLRTFFHKVDFAGILSSYGPYLTALLQSQKKSVVLLGHDVVRTALLPTYCADLPDSALQVFIRNVSHDDEDIGLSVVDSNLIRLVL